MIIAVLTIVAIVLILLYLFPIVSVCGDSMFPTYKDGEVLLTTRLFRKKKVKRGEVLVFKRDGKYVIKRLEDARKFSDGSYHFYVLGDNREFSYDSRNYGYLSYSQLKLKPISQRIIEGGC